MIRDTVLVFAGSLAYPIWHVVTTYYRSFTSNLCYMFLGYLGPQR
uniref:Reticulon-like protein n=1 Tax=Rhizophora mucronata TaxID=61149 RepID=A0A2P2JID2_RHIMU